MTTRRLAALTLAPVVALIATLGFSASASWGADATPSTVLLVPNLVQSGVSSPLVAEVSQDPAAGSPAGTVAFSDGYGTALGTATLVASGPGTSRASISWTAPPEYTVPLKASYIPTGATAPVSASGYMRPQITSAPVPVAIRFAPNPTAGPVTLEAVLGSGFQAGSASFLVDGKGWTGSVPTVNGVASVVWQATPGVHTIVVQYSSTANNPAGISLQSGQSTQMVEVLP